VHALVIDDFRAVRVVLQPLTAQAVGDELALTSPAPAPAATA